MPQAYSASITDPSTEIYRSTFLPFAIITVTKALSRRLPKQKPRCPSGQQRPIFMALSPPPPGFSAPSLSHRRNGAVEKKRHNGALEEEGGRWKSVDLHLTGPVTCGTTVAGRGDPWRRSEKRAGSICSSLFFRRDEATW